MSNNKQNTGIYFMGEAIADLKPDAENPRILNASLGGGSYFGCIGAARAIQEKEDQDIVSCFLGSISNDYFGQLIIKDFIKAGVKADYARKTENISMLALVSQTADGLNKFEFYGRNKPNTTEQILRSDLPDDLEEPARLFCFGSVVMTLSPARDTLTDYAAEQAKLGHIIYFDPNTRPNIIPDKAEYIERITKFAAFVSVMRASEEDIRWMFPDKPFEESAQYFLDQGVNAFIITQGGKGCTLYLPEQKSVYLPSKVEQGIINTVGAGDNFNAGVLLAMARRNLTQQEMLKSLDVETWKNIAKEANDVAYQHLLRLNGLTNKRKVA